MTMTHNNNTSIDITLDDNPDLELSLEETGIEGAVIIRIAGFIDIYNSDFFRSQAVKVVEAGYKNLLIDATAATFMSSTGIGAFTALLRHIREKQGSMIIYGMPDKIYKVFKLLGFTSFFQFCGSRDEALKMLDTDSSDNKEVLEVFPATISCPVCYRKLRAIRSGRFRCSSCRVILAVNNEGEVNLG